MIAPKTISHARGSVLMEFIIVCPLMLIIISAILQFAHIWIAREVTAYAAYCATRAVLSADKDAAATGAQKAAELACAWMCLAGLPGSDSSSGGESEDVTLSRLHDRDDIAETETVDLDNGAGVKGEILIPGWGSIPGSNSAAKRVKTDVKYDPPYARVTVKFKFPLLMPLVGRMISLFVNSDDASDMGEAGKVDYGSHDLTGGSNPAWKGETYVMDKDGNVESAYSSTAWGVDGKFPFIELTETAVLPMSYRLDKLTANAYADELQKIGGGL